MSNYKQYYDDHPATSLANPEHFQHNQFTLADVPAQELVDELEQAGTDLAKAQEDHDFAEAEYESIKAMRYAHLRKAEGMSQGDAAMALKADTLVSDAYKAYLPYKTTFTLAKQRKELVRKKMDAWQTDRSDRREVR